jgi:hypothetical protein
VVFLQALNHHAGVASLHYVMVRQRG